MATDLGVYDDYIASHLAGSDILLLEANHDISMLEAGSYFAPDKIKGSTCCINRSPKHFYHHADTLYMVRMFMGY